MELIRLFRKAMRSFSDGRVIGADINALAPAMIEADKGYVVPRCDDPGFIPAILDICKLEKIDLVIPLIDPELSTYAESSDIFLQSGVTVLISEPRTVEICSDKTLTARFFKEAALPYLKTGLILEDGCVEDIEFPAVLKPCRGSGGKDVFLVSNQDELKVLAKLVQEPVLQQRAEGQEITVDCLVDFNNNPLRIVARERLEIRAGESSKGRTFKDKSLLELVEKLLVTLKAIGPITIQCFRHNSEYVFTEINPRFGGGYPLSHAAGANFPWLIMAMCKDIAIDVQLDDYMPDIYFSRFDQAFYLRKDSREGEMEIIDGQ